MASEQEDLSALLMAPGWLRLCQHVEQEWAAQFESKVTQTIDDPDDLKALEKMRQIVVAKREVMRLLRWPKERLDTLARAAESREKETLVPLSRRGAL